MSACLPTGSGLTRAFACPASCALPATNRTTEESIGGTDNHAKMEALAVHLQKTGPDHGFRGELGLAGPHESLLLYCSGGGEVVGVERTYALDLVTGKARHLGDQLERNYSAKTADEIALTVDLVVRLPSGVVRVVDWKSRERVTACPENWQMRSAAMGAIQVESSPGGVEMVLAYLDDGETDSYEASSLDISAWWHDLFALRDKLRGAPTTLIHEGPWCKYCPAIHSCPAKTRLALAMIGELDIAAQVQEMTVEQGGRAWEKVMQAKDLVTRAEDALREKARATPLIFPNGEKLALVEQNGRASLDREAVEVVFQELGRPLPMKRGKPFDVVRRLKGK